VLLMRRAGTGFFDGLYSLPGGHVEEGESLRATAVREMREELGIELAEAALEVLGVVHRRSDTNRIDFFLRAQAWLGEPRIAEPNKCDDLRWFARDALPAPSCPTCAMPSAGAGPWIRESGWGWAGPRCWSGRGYGLGRRRRIAREGVAEAQLGGVGVEVFHVAAADLGLGVLPEPGSSSWRWCCRKALRILGWPSRKVANSSGKTSIGPALYQGSLDISASSLGPAGSCGSCSRSCTRSRRSRRRRRGRSG
jgi:ADP-ribose pyrophosphatase YjhB (NUDIX family)